MSDSTKNHAELKTKVSNLALNTLAVVFAAFPLISVGWWAQATFFGDPRHTTNLNQIVASPTPHLFSEPLVSVTFDDGWESVYTKAAPILQKYNIQSTQYVITGLLDSGKFQANVNYLSYDQAYSLKKAGHEIASHTAHHENLSQIPLSQAQSELHQSDDYLQQHGLAADQMSFASPNGATTPDVIETITRIYGSHRNVNADLGNGIDYKDINVAGHFTRWNIIGFTVRPDTPDWQIKGALDYAKAHNGWLVLVYHQVDDTNTGDKEAYSTTAQDLDRQLKMVKDSGIKTTTVRQVIDNRPKDIK